MDEFNFITIGPNSEVQKFSKILEPSQNSRLHKEDMNQVPHRRPINIRRQSTKFSLHGDLAPGICEPLS